MVVTFAVDYDSAGFCRLKRFENQNSLSDTIVWQLKEKLPLDGIVPCHCYSTFYNRTNSPPTK